jgi:chorismate dehydratase
MEEKLRVSMVEYLNAQPFMYGLMHHEVKNKISLTLDIPSECARKLIHNEAEIGLVPVAVIPQLKNFEIIGKTCIGAIGKVASVLLCSDVPLHEIEHVFLDFHSRTSVTLVQVLCKYFWKVNPQFVQAPEDYIDMIQNKVAGVIIGDRTFNLKKQYLYTYDLSEEWQKFTGLPFVFAAWVGKKGIDATLLNDFENALQLGLKNKDVVIKQCQSLYTSNFDVSHYLKTNIQYHFDDEKWKGLNLFYAYLNRL